MKNKIYEKMIITIVNQTAQIIGPVAIMQANNIKGLEVTAAGDISIRGNPAKKIGDLIKAYEILIGPVATTIAKRGIQKILEKNPKLKIPKELE
jgi:hypothetical protein